MICEFSAISSILQISVCKLYKNRADSSNKKADYENRSPLNLLYTNIRICIQMSTEPVNGSTLIYFQDNHLLSIHHLPEC